MSVQKPLDDTSQIVKFFIWNGKLNHTDKRHTHTHTTFKGVTLNSKIAMHRIIKQKVRHIDNTARF